MESRHKNEDKHLRGSGTFICSATCGWEHETQNEHKYKCSSNYSRTAHEAVNCGMPRLVLAAEEDASTIARALHDMGIPACAMTAAYTGENVTHDTET